MKFAGDYRIPAPREAVWQALNDTEILKASIDQLEALEWTAPDALRATVATPVGPLTARFQATITLTEVEPPHRYVLSGRGEGGMAGFAGVVARVRLEDDGEDATRLVYDCDVEIGGKLADVGGGVVKAVADRAAEAFLEGFTSRLLVAMAAAPFDLAALLGDADADGAAAGAEAVDAPFSWGGAGSRIGDRLRELEALSLTEQGAAGLVVGGASGTGAGSVPGGSIPLNATTAIIVAGWGAMAGILLLLFAI
ncbi:carbon monoxide dehydrogenase subunit G [Caenispirillum bisanense]|uniref:CoxG family protein n=1 Tax=Caenispirillum bisanense TaxID=414052 RepID=UPI0031D37DC7